MFPAREMVFSYISILLIVTETQCALGVSTTIGTIIGNTDNVEFGGEYKHVQRFLGIPYAKPPVEDRRFARPEHYGIFPSTYNATFHRPHCLQTKPPYYVHLEVFEKSEDCLYLNIYVPGDKISTKNKFPVMIYIHGGSFALGGADIYSGDTLSAFNDVIIVTINYRLGVFGFLSDGTKSAGNFGLWDMKMAIHWVHDHISAFGGDPTRVTLFGNSAGGAAVMYQATNPQNKRLIHRVIAQSGSNLAHWALQRNPLNRFMQYSAAVGCDAEDRNEILSCLRSKHAGVLQVSTFDFIPSVDDDFVLDKPVKLLSTDSPARDFFAQIDFMNGVTSMDGSVAMYMLVNLLEKANLNITNGVPISFFKEVYIPTRIFSLFGGVPKAMMESVMHQYIDWSHPNDAAIVKGKILELESDVSFFAPAIDASMKHQYVMPKGKKSTNYLYVFDHKPSFVPKPLWLKGAKHTMEVAYVFGLQKSLERKLIDDLGAIDPLKVTEDDIKLSKYLMTVWSNFAKTG